MCCCIFFFNHYANQNTENQAQSCSSDVHCPTGSDYRDLKAYLNEQKKAFFI